MTTGDVTKGIQNHVGLVQTLGTVTDSQRKLRIESLEEITVKLSNQVADQNDEIKDLK